MTRKDEHLTLPRAVLFDWDSTLVDNWHCIRWALNAALVAMGHKPWSETEARLRVRRSMRDSFPELFGDRWAEARRVFYETYEAHHLNHLKAMPGAETMIGALSERRIYLGVVSNKMGPLLRREAACLGWDRYFGRVVGATDAVRDKPDAAPAALALSDSDVPCGPEVWFVGDTAIDMACAVNAACIPVLIESASGAGDDFSSCPPRIRVPDCAALTALVSTLREPHMTPSMRLR